MKKIWYSLLSFGVLSIITIFLYLHYNYLYYPMGLPGGNITQEEYSFRSFNKPIVAKVRKWDFQSKKVETVYIKNQGKVKDLLNNYANSKSSSNSQESISGATAEYEISFYDVENLEENEGNIVLAFSFFNNNEVFSVQDREYFILNKEFKDSIIDSL